MKISTVLLCASLALMLFCSSATAWSGAGHQVIAAEAYRQLSPALQKKVTEVLKAHPQYEKWKGSFISNREDLDFGLSMFMRASVWPDEIRRGESDFNHPKWHYIDYPLKPSRFRVEAGPSPDDDILYGIRQCERTLSDHKSTPEADAVYLSWLIHLIGDLHQPLHCSSFFASAYPKGDKGGNDFFVKPAARGISLHSFWDGLLGTSGKPQAHLNYAIAIQSEHPRKSLRGLKKSRTAKDWSLESRSLALEKAYLRGKLKGGVSREIAPDLPDGYTKSAKTAAEKQAALAGCRLADEIQKWMR